MATKLLKSHRKTMIAYITPELAWDLSGFYVFIQFQSNTVIAVCTSMGKLWKDNANSKFGILGDVAYLPVNKKI